MYQQERYFSPHVHQSPSRELGCLSCEFNRGKRTASNVVCERFEKVRVVGDPRIGCAYWMRAPGADDGLGEPVTASRTDE